MVRPLYENTILNKLTEKIHLLHQIVGSLQTLKLSKALLPFYLIAFPLLLPSEI